MADTPIVDRDFRSIGLVWIVRHRRGGRQRFYVLRDLLDARAAGEVADDAALSCDGVAWRLIGRIEDIEALFEETWLLSADENASAIRESVMVDEPSVRLKFVPLSDTAPPRPVPVAAVAPPEESGADDPEEGWGRRNTATAASLAVVGGVLMALAVAAILYALYGH